MKAQLAFGALLLTSLAFASMPSVGSTNNATTKVTGDYVEARTASVFAGACHYNGELVTTGDEAIAAWSISSGNWKGADLTGLRAVAAVACDKNLGQGGNRRSELLVDSSATPAQVAAFTDLLRTECGKQLGSIVAVHQGPVSFTRDGRSFTVKADGFASMSVDPMPNDECCKQPNLVWYSPLAPIDNRKVGYTNSAVYAAGIVGDRWDRGGENSAFYGTFSY
ncbi:MAG TPA: DUF1326 domain-containing protein [Phycisphaerae bacterium]|nr:DUF1326 domain-containing protein [Phycisphaerae bacterium]